MYVNCQRATVCFTPNVARLIVYSVQLIDLFKLFYIVE